jgi:hypothetical protein
VVAAIWQWVAAVVPTPLGGVVIGALATLVGGFGGSLALGRIESRREKQRHAEAHAAAVRAVFTELAGNVATIRECERMQSTERLAVSREAYTALLLPLFSGRMPNQTASELAAAYAYLARIDKCEPAARWDIMLQAKPVCDKAAENLFDYAQSTLKLRFWGDRISPASPLLSKDSREN